LVLSAHTARVAIRPSGTEPKVKAYLEVHLPPRDDVAAARVEAARILEDLRTDVVGLLQRGPN
jgi:phosphomannomutase